jgi:type I restriction enzyme S subunit
MLFNILNSRKENKLEQENQELASLGDWLLPMLMNGQVSVGGYDVEESVWGMVAESGEEYKKVS